MSAAATHADWLALVDPTGPFLTLPVLRRAFPAGLDRTPPALRAEFRVRRPGPDADTAARTAWIDWVLQTGLRYGPMLCSGPEVPDTLQHYVAEHTTLLRPDHALVSHGPAGEHTRLLITVYPPRTSWSAHLPGEPWAATPVERMALLCRATGVSLGLLTDGDRFTLVHAPREAAVGTATWPVSLFSEERVLLDSFLSVLGARRFFSVGAGETLEALLADSANAQAEVTNQLGKQVRQAVELLVGAFSRANRERHGALLDDVDPHDVYAAAVTVMMRLVFLLYAEERHLLPLGDVLYDASYAASTLREALQEEADLLGEETLERRAGAWHRLLALFRAVSLGIAHDRLRIPAYGGSLFDPDRYPFLEGRQPNEPWQDGPSEPLPVDDLSVLALLSALQVLVFTEGGVREARRLSFRSLDVGQIGHVYEGLLDHGVRRVDEVVLGLVGRKGDEPERPLAALESRRATSQYTLADYVVEETGKSDRYVTKALEAEPTADECRLLLAACDNDQAVYNRVLPYAGLLRPDLRGLPTVFLPGSVVVTEVSSRRDSGTQYTTRDLADEIVRYTLEPLVYSPGPAEGAEPADWKLKSSEEILALKVCDPAVGSGAILVAACRYLAERVVEAWVAEGLADVRPEPEVFLGDEPDDALMRARRAVVDHCLYGVDRDPMAVEMAKLSLWLTTMSRERPFSFLDHALRSGDTLLGVTDLAQVEHLHLDPAEGQRIHATLFDYTAAIAPLVKTAVEKRRQLQAIPVLTVRDAEAKASLNAEANAAMMTVGIIADVVVGAAVSTAGRTAGPTFNDRLRAVANKIAMATDLDLDAFNRVERLQKLQETADGWLNGHRPDSAPERRCLHWPVAFPEVFLDKASGFDACIGNPPFLGGKRIRGAVGDDVRAHLVETLAGGKRGSADLVAFFFLRAASLAESVGFLATNTVAQGDTREVGLDQLLERGWIINRAVKSVKWPGSASLEIAKLWLSKAWNGEIWLDGTQGARITSELAIAGRSSGAPRRSAALRAFSHIGSLVNGTGFILSPAEAGELIAADARNSEVVHPYLSGEDMNSAPDQGASRWIINFQDWPIEQAATYQDCFEIVDRKVRPVRETVRRASYRDKWWRFAERQARLYEAISQMDRTLAITIVSRTLQPVFVRTNQVFSHRVCVLAYDDDFHFGVLSSTFHYWWVLRYSSTLGASPNYAPTDCFETFPQPLFSSEVAHVARALDEHRSDLMLVANEGLTKTYTRVHSENDSTAPIVELREFHKRADEAVAAAYGWDDLDLDHGFHETSQGVRYTIGLAARTEMLDRLLELNHERYAAEETPPSRISQVDKAKRSLRPKPSKRGDAAANTLEGTR